jgi:GNAT superfamily N-acetyltransferase
MQAFISDMRCPISVSFLEEYAPLLPDALLEAGWIASHHVPVMHCAPGDLVQETNLKGLSISILNCNTPLEEIKVAMDVNAAGFAPDAEPTTDDEAFDFRENLGSGKVFLARYEGQPAATGMYADMVDGIAEPLGITTLPAFRNLGIGVFMVGAMTRSAYVDGATWVIAQAFTPIIENIYLQVGYQQIATQVIYRLPELVSG